MKERCFNKNCCCFFSEFQSKKARSEVLVGVFARICVSPFTQMLAQMFDIQSSIQFYDPF